LLYFFVVGSSLTHSLIYHLPEQIKPFSPHTRQGWQGNPTDALPFIVDAYESCIEKFRLALLSELETRYHRKVVVELTSALRHLSHPDPNKRGHPRSKAALSENDYAMQRFIPLFDRLSKTISKAN
jgi:hypothetical protein